MEEIRATSFQAGNARRVDDRGTTTTSYGQPQEGMMPMDESSRKPKWEHEGSESLTPLWKGSFLMKHGRQGKPKVHYFQLSQDCRVLSWRRSSGTSRYVELRWVQDILLGQQTTAFQKRPMRHDAASLSLVYVAPSNGLPVVQGQERTLDLTFFDQKQRDIWYHGLYEVINNRVMTDGQQMNEDNHPKRADRMRDLFLWGNCSVNGIHGTDGLMQKIDGLSAIVPSYSTASANEGQLLRSVSGKDCWPRCPVPMLMPANNLINVKLASIGRRHAVIFSEYGNLYAFGDGKAGKLGLGHFDDCGSPQRIRHGVDAVLSERVVQISCGDDISAALTDEGRMYVWGKVGVGTSPMSIPTLWNSGPLSRVCVRHISCGPFHCGAISEEGKLFMWGEGLGGKLGLGDVRSRSQPSCVKHLPGKVIKVACGVWHTAAVVEDIHDTGTHRTVSHEPRNVIQSPAKNVKHRRSISSFGSLFGTTQSPDVFVSCYREGQGGTLYTWGGVSEAVSFGNGEQTRDSNKGCLGHGEQDAYTGQLYPTIVQGPLDGTTVRDVAAGAHLTVVLTTAGSVFQMGTTGALTSSVGSSFGIAPWEGAFSPTCVRGAIAGVFVDKISCGMHHVLVAGRNLDKRSGEPVEQHPTLVFTWGRGVGGQLGNGKLEDAVSPVPVEGFKVKNVLDVICGGSSSAVLCEHDPKSMVDLFSKEAWDRASRHLCAFLDPKPSNEILKSSKSLSMRAKSLSFMSKRTSFVTEMEDIRSGSTLSDGLSSRGSFGRTSGTFDLSRPSKSIVSINEASASGASVGIVRRSAGQFASQHSMASTGSWPYNPSFAEMESQQSGVMTHRSIASLSRPHSPATDHALTYTSSGEAAMVPSRWKRTSQSTVRSSLEGALDTVVEKSRNTVSPPSKTVVDEELEIKSLNKTIIEQKAALEKQKKELDALAAKLDQHQDMLAKRMEALDIKRQEDTEQDSIEEMIDDDSWEEELDEVRHGLYV